MIRQILRLNEFEICAASRCFECVVFHVFFSMTVLLTKAMCTSPDPTPRELLCTWSIWTLCVPIVVSLSNGERPASDAVRASSSLRLLAADWCTILAGHQSHAGSQQTVTSVVVTAHTAPSELTRPWLIVRVLGSGSPTLTLTHVSELTVTKLTRDRELSDGQPFPRECCANCH